MNNRWKDVLYRLDRSMAETTKISTNSDVQSRLDTILEEENDIDDGSGV